MALAHSNGRWAEDKAADYLVQKGLRIIDRNVRKKMGELDIICRDGCTWVCVEVKFRSDPSHGHPMEMVNHRKLNRMIAAFNLYLMDNNLNPAHTDIRFDLIALDENELTWLRNVTM